MNTITGLMIGWGFFWLCAWLVARFVFQRLATGYHPVHPPEEVTKTERDYFAEMADVCWIGSLLAVCWMMAWAVVRSIVL